MASQSAGRQGAPRVFPPALFSFSHPPNHPRATPFGTANSLQAYTPSAKTIHIATQNHTFCTAKPYLSEAERYGFAKRDFGLHHFVCLFPFGILFGLRMRSCAAKPKKQCKRMASTHFSPLCGASRAATQQKREALAHRRKPLFCCPKRIRTTTNRTKTCCATVTP